MSLEKNDVIEIRQVANGFVVMHAINYARAGIEVTDDDRCVFQTFAELMEFLGRHFTHRSPAILTDK